MLLAVVLAGSLALVPTSAAAGLPPVAPPPDGRSAASSLPASSWAGPSAPMAPATTRTTLAVAPAPGGATTLTARVEASAGTPSGSVTVRDGATVLAVLPLDRGVASFTTSALAADVTHTLSAHYQGHGADAQSWSEPHTVGDPARSGTGTVTVTIPVGSLTITSPAGGSVALEPVGRRPASATGRAGVAVTDTRAGDLGFTVSAAVVGAPRAAVTLADARAVQVPGNGLQAADVTIAPARHRLAGSGVAVATYPAGRGTGTVVVTGTVLATGAAARLGSVRLVWTVL